VEISRFQGVANTLPDGPATPAHRNADVTRSSYSSAPGEL